MVDMAHWLLGDLTAETWGQTGPMHPDLNIPMDITIAMRSARGALVTSAQSFNHHGPIQGHYRLIGEETTLLVEQGKLIDHTGSEIAIPNPKEPVEEQNREFFTAIREDRKALTSCSDCLPVMEALHRIQRAIDTH
tara:strand:- start:152 stop:559 length:408 start_codon:yes stop_codon:yes gene_type:complete